MSCRAWLASAILVPTLLGCSPSVEPPASPAPYGRIVSLAPNLTELVFASGADDLLVGVSAYSDYPAAARLLPVVGDAFTIDRERLALLRPDALLVWESGTPAHVIDEMRRAGFTVEVLRTRTIADVADALRKIGELTGRQAAAEQAAKQFLEAIALLDAGYAGAPEITVFYQVSRRPLYTINGEHFVSELLELCGGRNVFSELEELAPTIDVEAVVARDPEVMLASDTAGADAFADWQRWPTMAANRYGNHYLIPADTVGRATPRMVEAGRVICDVLEQARERRGRMLS